MSINEELPTEIVQLNEHGNFQPQNNDEAQNNDDQSGEKELPTQIISNEVRLEQSEKANIHSNNTDFEHKDIEQPTDIVSINPLESFNNLNNANGNANEGHTKIVDIQEYHKECSDNIYKYKLKIISGNNKGKEFFIDRPQLTIGRNSNCDIQLSGSDEVSGNHALLYSNGDKNYILDDNSTNGTFLNGNRLISLKKFDLTQNDTIVIGEYKLKFMSQEASTSKTKIVLISLLLIMLMFLFSQFINNKSSQVEKTPIEIQKFENKDDSSTKDNQGIAAEEVADIIFNAANNYLEHQLWEEAIDEFNKVLHYNLNYPGVSEKIEHAKFEIENRQKLEMGQLLIKQNMIKDGIQKLKEISEKSAYFMDAFTDIQLAIKKPKSTLKVKQPVVHTPKKKLTPKKPVVNIEKEKRKGEILFDKAIHFYAKEDISRSIKNLQLINQLKLPDKHELKTKARDTIHHLKKIDQLMQKGLQFFHQNNLDEALIYWNDAITIEKTVLGAKKSKLQHKINQLQSEYCFKNAKQYFDSENFEQAVFYCNQCKKLKTKHNGLADIENKLCEKAKKEYENGYIIEDLNPESAIKSWEIVLKTCTSNCEYYQKAKSSIKKYKNYR